MAFLKTSDSIVIKATLTEKGKKLLARGKFKIAKFTLGDDEIDYSLFRTDKRDEVGYFPAILNLSSLEAYKNINKNIQYGLDSYDSGVLYLSEEQLADNDQKTPHAYVEYLPILKTNNKISYSPTLKNDKYYVSINDETTKIINDGVPSFKFLQTNDFDIRKIVIESGIEGSPATSTAITARPPIKPTVQARENLIVKKFLLDRDYFVCADNRFISTIVGIQESSRFENFSSNESLINFSTDKESVAISLESEFEYFATYLVRSIPNMMFEFDDTLTEAGGFLSSNFSAIEGPRGSVFALNIKVDNELKTNSTGARDERFSKFGTLNTSVFSEIPSSKFDYIDTTIYIIGVTSNARLQVPLRIIRYVGT